MNKIDEYVSKVPAKTEQATGDKIGFWGGATLGIVCGIMALMIPTLALAFALLIVARYGFKFMKTRDNQR